MPESYDWNPYNLPDGLMKAIGTAMAAASQTESILNMAIMGCVGVDSEYGMALTAHMAVPLKFSILKSVAEIKIDDLDALDELDVILEKIDQAIGKRNAIAHDGFARIERTGQLIRTSYEARTRLEVEIVPVTIFEIEADARAIYDAGLALMKFLGNRGLLAPIPAPRPRAHKSKAARKARRKKAGK